MLKCEAKMSKRYKFIRVGGSFLRPRYMMETCDEDSRHSLTSTSSSSPSSERRYLLETNMMVSQDGISSYDRPYMGIDEFFKFVGRADYGHATYEERLQKLEDIRRQEFFSHASADARVEKLKILETLKPKEIFNVGCIGGQDIHITRSPNFTEQQQHQYSDQISSKEILNSETENTTSERQQRKPLPRTPPDLIQCIVVSKSNTEKSVVATNTITRLSSSSPLSSPFKAEAAKSNDTLFVSRNDSRKHDDDLDDGDDLDDEDIDIIADDDDDNNYTDRRGKNCETEPAHAAQGHEIDENHRAEDHNNSDTCSNSSEVYNQSIENFSAEKPSQNTSNETSAKSLLSLKSNEGESEEQNKKRKSTNQVGEPPIKKRGGGKLGRRRKRGYIYDPKPLVPKTKTNALPSNMKDEEYWHRRQRNNAAAKRSRENRRVKELETMNLVKRLTDNNTELKEKIKELELRNIYLERLLRGRSDNTLDSGGSDVAESRSK